MMTIFHDRQGRAISIETDDCDAIARFQGKRIGEVLTTGIREIGKGSELSAKITGMSVDAAYRKSGIGLALIEALSNEIGTLEPADKNIGIGGVNALTEEGLSLTRRAQSKGFVHPFQDEQPEWERDDDE